MESEIKQKDDRQPYEKPRLRTIELVAEEVLAVGCKNASIPAFGNPVCMVTPCTLDGS